jgi:hypothetical protein
LIASSTSIPVPKIHAYAFGNGPEPFPSFLILEYVEGRQINYAELKALPDEQRTRLYASLADIYIQLRRLVFPSIGRLKQSLAGPQVAKRNTSIDLNMQELEGLDPSTIQDMYYGGSDTLCSASRYVAMLLDLADNAFARGRGTVSDVEQGRDRIYHLHMFRQYAQGWLNDKLDHGPFVLAHGDLEIFNLILDDDMDIISVLDWEWSRVVPLQLFRPPLWLDSTTIENLCHGARYRFYLDRFDSFLAVLRARERERYGNELLANEWNKQKQKSGFMVSYALEHWTAMDWFANRYINLRVYGGKHDLPERVMAYVNDDPARQALVEQKVRDWDSYVAELEQLSRAESLEGQETTTVTESQPPTAGSDQTFLPRASSILIPSTTRGSRILIAWAGLFAVLAVALTAYMIGERSLL